MKPRSRAKLTTGQAGRGFLCIEILRYKWDNSRVIIHLFIGGIMPKESEPKHLGSWVAVGVVVVALIMTGMTVFGTTALSNTDNTTGQNLDYDWRSQFVSVASPSGSAEASSRTYLAYYSISPDKHCLEWATTGSLCVGGWTDPGPLKSFTVDLDGTAVAGLNGHNLTAEVTIPSIGESHTLVGTVSQGSATLTFPEEFFPVYGQTTYGAKVDIYADTAGVSSGSTLQAIFTGMFALDGTSINYLAFDSYGIVGDGLNVPNPAHWVTITKPVLEVTLHPNSPIGTLPVQYYADVAKFVLFAPSAAIEDVNVFSLRMSGSAVASMMKPKGRYFSPAVYVRVDSNPKQTIRYWQQQGEDLVAYVDTTDLGTIGSGTSKIITVGTILENTHQGDTLTLTLEKMGPNAKVEFQTLPVSGHTLTLVPSGKSSGKKK